MMQETKETVLKNTKTPIYWVIAVDGKQARIFVCDAFDRVVSLRKSSRHDLATRKTELRLVQLANETIKAETSLDYNIGHDKRGSVFGSATSARHTIEPHIDVRKEIRARHVRRVAARLEAAWRQGLFDRVVIAAPQAMLGEIESFITPNVQASIAGTLPKNFSRHSARQILPQVQQWLPTG